MHKDIIVIHPPSPIAEEKQEFYLCRNPALAPYEEVVLGECRKRFKKFAVVAGTGSVEKSIWIGRLRMDDDPASYMDDLALAARASIPIEYEVILYIDNPQNCEIRTHQGVWYFKTPVWTQYGPQVSIWDAITTPKSNGKLH